MENSFQMGWQDYLAIIWRRRWHFAVPCVMIVTVSMIVGSFMPKIYRAETTIMIQEPNVTNPLVQGIAAVTPVSQQMARLKEQILSWSSLTRLIDELDLDKGTKNAFAIEQTVKRLQKDIQVWMRGHELMLIGYEDPDPQMAQKLVNTVSSIFLEQSVASQTSETHGAMSFIEREMDVYKQKLEASEKALRDFRELYMAQMPVATELNQQLVGLEVDRARLLVENTERHPAVAELTRRIQELKNRRDVEIKKFVASSITRGQDPAVYQDLLRVLENPNQPPADLEGMDPTKVQAAKKAYSAWMERLDRPVQHEKLPPNTPTQVQVVMEGGSQGAPEGISRVEASPLSIAVAPWQEQELQRLTRDYEVSASIYQNLLQRLQRGKITQRLETSDQGLQFQVLEPARLPLRPFKPNLFRTFFLSLVLGIFVGAATAFAAEYLDQSFQSEEDIQEVLKLPVLASIGRIVTVEDVERRRQLMKERLSVRGILNLGKQWIIRPVAVPVARGIDALMVRWKL